MLSDTEGFLAILRDTISKGVRRMHLLFVDYKQLLQEKLVHLSREESVIAIYLHQNHALLGALIHALKINLADVLLGKASIEHADVLLLTFPDHADALNAFGNIPQEVQFEGEKAALHVELWTNGNKETETSFLNAPVPMDFMPQTTSFQG